MEALKRFYKKTLARLAWALLKAADFDAIAIELVELCDKFQDPAAMIPRRFAELQGANSRLEGMVLESENRIRRLEKQFDKMSDEIRASQQPEAKSN